MTVRFVGARGGGLLVLIVALSAACASDEVGTTGGADTGVAADVPGGKDTSAATDTGAGEDTAPGSDTGAAGDAVADASSPKDTGGTVDAELPDDAVQDVATEPDVPPGSDTGATPDGAADAGEPDDTGEGDTGQPQLAQPEVLVAFNANAFELPEGIAVDEIGNIAVSFAGRGSVVLLKIDGATKTEIPLSEDPAADSYTLGLLSKPGEIYAAVAAGGANPVPAPGVYKVSADGSVAPFADHPAMFFPNDFELVGDTMLLSDSTGTIYSVTEGNAEVWSNHELLQGDLTACGGTGQLDIGVNGLASDGATVYAAITDTGRILAYPAAGGEPSVLVEDCALAGADGIVVDEDGSIIVAVNRADKLVRVQTDGTMSTLAAGPPLDFPASLAIRTLDGKRQLLITNTALISIAVPGMTPAPSVAVLEL